jgi:hypothetical protein
MALMPGHLGQVLNGFNAWSFRAGPEWRGIFSL